MKSDILISDYLSGKLLGDIIANSTDKKLSISRYSRLDSNKSNNKLILLHQTKGYIDNKRIGYASTYLDGDIEMWQLFQSIRMNKLLNMYGYVTYDYQYIPSKKEVSRTIKSLMKFGTIIIKEKIFFSRINNK